MKRGLNTPVPWARPLLLNRKISSHYCKAFQWRTTSQWHRGAGCGSTVRPGELGTGMIIRRKLGWGRQGEEPEALGFCRLSSVAILKTNKTLKKSWMFFVFSRWLGMCWPQYHEPFLCFLTIKPTMHEPHHHWPPGLSLWNRLPWRVSRGPSKAL